MNAVQKQAETQKAKLLEIVRQNPGISGPDERVPQCYRRWFRSLEAENKIEYREGWFVK